MQLIKAKVENYWIRPEHFATGASCVMQVQLLPGGQVHRAYIVRSSGQPNFDQTAILAVQKASPLPIPQTVFESFKTFNFQFSQ
jgi:colicin import membrane protein